MKRNLIAKILLFSGIVLLLAGIYPSIKLAFIYDHTYDYTYQTEEPPRLFDMSYFLQGYLSFFMYGMVLIWFSEMIRLLENLLRRQPAGAVERSGENSLDPALERETDSNPVLQQTVSKEAEGKIHDLYASKAILEIHASHVNGYFIVRLQEYQGPPQSYLRVVDTNGYKAEEVKDKKLADEIIAAHEKDTHN